jgi:hypothetical protein
MMDKGTKQLLAGAVIGIASGYIAQQTRKALGDDMSPLATALIVTLVGAVATQVLRGPVNRLIVGESV